MSQRSTMEVRETPTESWTDPGQRLPAIQRDTEEITRERDRIRASIRGWTQGETGGQAGPGREGNRQRARGEAERGEGQLRQEDRAETDVVRLSQRSEAEGREAEGDKATSPQEAEAKSRSHTGSSPEDTDKTQ